MDDLSKDFEEIKPTIKEAALKFKRSEKAAEETNDAVRLHRAVRIRNKTLDALRTKFGIAVWYEFFKHYYGKNSIEGDT